MAQTRFVELARGQIGTNKFIVVSQRSDGRVSIAQQVEAATDDQPIHIFLKNAIIVDPDGLDEILSVLMAAREALGHE